VKLSVSFVECVMVSDPLDFSAIDH
jgi:hypothetical protein